MGDSIVLRAGLDLPVGHVEVEINGEKKVYKPVAPFRGARCEDGGLFLEFDWPRQVELRDAIKKGILRPVDGD